MKYWLSHLPLEVWVDCYRYPWISRRELARIVDRFSNWNYVEYLQFYLHDWGRRKMDELFFAKNGMCKYVRHGYPISSSAVIGLDFPQTPMPANIKSFESISISHFDAQTVAFLHQIQPILKDVKLKIFGISNLDNLRTILTNMVPQIQAVHSLFCGDNALPTVAQCFGGEKWAKVKVLEISYNQNKVVSQESIQLLMDWLIPSAQREHNDGPKLCEAIINGASEFPGQIVAPIRQQFLEAKSPTTFAVILRLDLREWKWEVADEFHLENDVGEELHGTLNGHGDFQISRHRANCGKGLQEWIEANKAQSHRGRIEVVNPTVGSIDALMDVREVFEEDPEKKPSTSEKAI